MCAVELKKYRQDLPAYMLRRDVIVDVFEKKPGQSRFSMVVGHTGSGKSTQVPQYILVEFLKRGI